MSVETLNESTDKTIETNTFLSENSNSNDESFINPIDDDSDIKVLVNPNTLFDIILDRDVTEYLPRNPPLLLTNEDGQKNVYCKKKYNENTNR